MASNPLAENEISFNDLVARVTRSGYYKDHGIGVKTLRYMNASLNSIRVLRRAKSDLLSHMEKGWIDQQIDFAQFAVERLGESLEYIGAAFADKDEQHKRKISEELKVAGATMAMNGLNTAMTILSSRTFPGGVFDANNSESTHDHRDPATSEPCPPYGLMHPSESTY